MYREMSKETEKIGFNPSQAELDMWVAKYKLWCVLHGENHRIVGVISHCKLCPNYQFFSPFSMLHCPLFTISFFGRNLAKGEGLIIKQLDGDTRDTCMEWIKHV